MKSRGAARESGSPSEAIYKISVCIAAYNEAARIGRLLKQLCLAAGAELDEILVCANGCEDGTEAVVAAFHESDSRVALIVSEKGKPAAWNALMRAARNDLRLFVDADVVLADGFLPAMKAAVQRTPSAAIIAARDLPVTSAGGLGPQLAALASAPFGFDYVCGRAYMLRRSAIEDAAHPAADTRAGVPIEMPLNVLAEDLWLEACQGRKKIAFARDAYVYYEPGDVADVLRARARLRVARKQVETLMPEAFARWRTEFYGSSRYARVRRRLGTMDDISDVLACTVGAAARAVLFLMNRTAVRRMEAQMLRQLSSEGGQAVLSGSGRVQKKGA